MQSIIVSHNAEMAHRLFQTPGKCEMIHGHSWRISLELFGNIDETGKLCGLDFGEVKRKFRGYIDDNFDHRLLLNSKDPLAERSNLTQDKGWIQLPGLQRLDNLDPTTENLAKHIGTACVAMFKATGVTGVEIVVLETATNAATWSSLD